MKRIFALFVVLATIPAVRAQDATSAPQGLAVTFERLGGGGGADTRVARLPALYVPEGLSPSPFLPPGPFKATWRGDLNLRLRERLAFSAEGRGKVTVAIRDKVVFEASGEDLSQRAGEVIRINKGANPIVITYESPEKGNAFVRLLWKEQAALRAEPVPPMVFGHDPGTKQVLEGERVRQGRQLLAELRCTKCHDAGEANAAGMPELAMDTPSFKDIGGRVTFEWMAAWVADPRRFRADAHMPRVFHDGDAASIKARARDVAWYLASTLRIPSDTESPAAAEQLNAGGRLFSTLNCVACHTPPDAPPDEAADARRVPLRHVRTKFTRYMLERYLRKPHEHYAWNPMPDFKLGDDEAAALTAYVRTKAVGRLDPPAPGQPPPNAENGRRLVASSGCLNCHAAPDDARSTLRAPGLSEIRNWSAGCMATTPAARKGAPDFGLTDGQRAALAAFAATDRSSLARDAADEFSRRQVAAMRCTACHGRDGRESLVGTDFAADAAALAAAFPPPQPAGGGGVQEGEHFAPDQRPPILTWAGEKLRPEWATEFIAGRIPHRIRPYLHARMPAWPTRAELLAKGLAAEHGYSPSTPPYPPPDESMAAAGQKLIGTVGGFSCVQCHAVGAAPPNAPFEAPALNMRHVTARLRKDYYHRWMLNPIKVDPATKMPAFADFEGKSAIRDVYEGDGVKQFEAVWQFLLHGDDVKPAN